MLKNIYIYVSDDLRYDYTPDKIKSLGLSFKSISQAPFSHPSFSSLVTGVGPETHQVYNKHIDNIKGPTIFDLDKFKTSYWAESEYDSLYSIFNHPNRIDLENIDEPFILLERALETHAPFGKIHKDIKEYEKEVGNDYQKMKKYYKIGIEKSDAIIVPTKGFLEDFPRLKKYKDKIDVVPNGVDLETFSKYKNGNNNLDKKILEGVSEHENVLLFVGSLVERKGIKTLLESFEKVIKNYPDTGLIIVGKGPLETHIRMKAKKGGYIDKLYLTGYISDLEDLAKIFSFSDLFVFPSQAETFGRVVLESMAAGTPCLVSDIGVLMDVIDQGSVGLYGKVNDPISFASKIIKFFEMDEKERKIMENKVVEYAKGYSWEDVARQMEEIYEELLYMRDGWLWKRKR